MKRYRGVWRASWLGVVLWLALTPSVRADIGDLTFNPAAPDFGAVPVGESASLTITVTNNDGEVAVTAVELTGDPSFSISSVSGLLPLAMSHGDTFTVEVTFAPTTPGPVSAVLTVTAGMHYPVTITGRGISSAVPLVDEALDYFDAAVAGGTLVGTGPGASADGRLSALRNMIENARRLLQEGLPADACAQLRDAQNRVDGDPHIPDFASGPAAAGLGGLLADLLETLDYS